MSQQNFWGCSLFLKLLERTPEGGHAPELLSAMKCCAPTFTIRMELSADTDGETWLCVAVRNIEREASGAQCSLVLKNQLRHYAEFSCLEQVVKDPDFKFVLRGDQGVQYFDANEIGKRKTFKVNVGSDAVVGMGWCIEGIDMIHECVWFDNFGFFNKN